MENKYNQLLYESLKKHNLLFERQMNVNWREDFQKYFELVSPNLDLAKLIRMEFQYNVLNIYLINCKKLCVISKFFVGRINIYKVQSGVYFVVLGCLLDYLMDNGTDAQRQLAKEKISWKYCAEYFEKGITAKSDSSIDILYELLGKALLDIKQKNSLYYEEMLYMIKSCVDSELYVVSEKNNSIEERITNKSVLFVMIYILLMVDGYEKYEEIKAIAYSIGNVFAIIDDLCDVFEDRRIGQKNVVNNVLLTGEFSIGQVIEIQIQRIEEELTRIKIMSNKEIYEFVLAEVQEWTMSNQYLRERIWFELLL